MPLSAASSYASGRRPGGISCLGHCVPQLIDSGPLCWEVSSSSSSSSSSEVRPSHPCSLGQGLSYKQGGLAWGLPVLVTAPGRVLHSQADLGGGCIRRPPSCTTVSFECLPSYSILLYFCTCVSGLLPRIDAASLERPRIMRQTVSPSACFHQGSNAIELPRSR